jgi:nicotinamidase-related amidase
MALPTERGASNVSSEPTRDPVADALLTPQNCALLVIDFQPLQFSSVMSMDRDLLTRNIVTVARLAKAYGVPIVLSTVNVVANGLPPTVPELRDALSDSVELDRTQMNAWEDVEFKRAVEATGRKKLVITALWTEICLTFPTLDALREGYEVFPVVDAVGGTSPEAHRAALERIVQAGAQPISWVSLAGELQRDWARTETVSNLLDLVLNSRLEAGDQIAKTDRVRG